MFEQNRQPLITGVYGAMTLPRTKEGTIDLAQLDHHMTSLLKAALRGFVLNGATGEYCLTTPEELGAMLRQARMLCGPDIKLIAAVGGADTRQTLRRVSMAEEAGADGLLLPMPYFFPYEQQDLEEYAVQVGEQSRLPLLLYNLPDFTTPLQPETSLRLLTNSARFCGIKDSSGSLDTVRLLAQRLPGANRVIGSDSVLHAALAEGLCDGVVSGVSCVLPELMLSLYKFAGEDARSENSLQLKAALDGFLDWLVRLPAPWALKAIAEELGLAKAEYALPLSARRKEQLRDFITWFRRNRATLLT